MEYYSVIVISIYSSFCFFSWSSTTAQLPVCRVGDDDDVDWFAGSTGTDERR